MKKIIRTFLSLMLIMCIMPIGISAEEKNYQDIIDEYVYIDCEGNEHRYFDENGNGAFVTAAFPITTAAGYTDGLYELITRDA